MLILVFTGYILLPAGFGPEVYVRVETGSGARKIGRDLVEQGVLRSADVFALWTRLLGAQGRLQAGEYKVRPGMTPPVIVWQMKKGRVASAGITIPEGFNLTQIAETLANARLVDKDEFLTLARHATSLLAGDTRFAPPTASLEGYLFPDTYRIAPGTPVAEILHIMLNRTAEKVLPLVENTPMPAGFDLHKLLTLASIVEKEAQIADERPLIASVFLNRLRRGMPLQSDPTVKYVLSPAPLRLSRTDIAIDSPYNTYRFKGLPPGPIASPGMASVQAVLHPANTDYLYFVARGDGSHMFSKTYQEHLANRKLIAAGLGPN